MERSHRTDTGSSGGTEEDKEENRCGLEQSREVKSSSHSPAKLHQCLHVLFLPQVGSQEPCNTRSSAVLLSPKTFLQPPPQILESILKCN